MAFPTRQQYMVTAGLELRALQEKIVEKWFKTLEKSSTFQDFSMRSQRLAQSMQNTGYTVRLYDEDGESMIVHEVWIDNNRSLTAQVYWDPDEGSSVCCVFVDRGVPLALTVTENQPSIVVAPEQR